MFDLKVDCPKSSALSSVATGSSATTSGTPIADKDRVERLEPLEVPAPPPSPGSSSVSCYLVRRRGRSKWTPQKDRPSFWSPQLPAQQSVEDFCFERLPASPAASDPSAGVSVATVISQRLRPTLLQGMQQVRRVSDAKPVLGPKPSCGTE